jgi:transcriptional regulator with XRE-family HTH domain
MTAGLMPEAADLIRTARLARSWTLRQLGDAVGVTPAYIADIEAGRRQPSVELQDRLSAALAIPSEELAAADSRLSKDLRDWIEERPQLTSLLRAVRSSPNSDALVVSVA